MITIVDYGLGNVKAFSNMYKRLNIETRLARSRDDLAGASKIILPGVGHFDHAMDLLDRSGMRATLDDLVVKQCLPVMGICVGMQLMSERGLEKVVTKGFGWIKGDVKEIVPSDPRLKIPQIGWNTIDLKRPHPLFDGIATGARGLHAYFVHSYHLDAKDPADVVAVADYGGPVTAAVAKDNLAGTQFHPEKSQALGLALIANFLRWRPQ